MATMEVDIKQYNGMLKTIEALENDVIRITNENKVIEQKLEKAEENLEIFRNSNWYDRVFGWKQMLKLTKTESEDGEL